MRYPILIALLLCQLMGKAQVPIDSFYRDGSTWTLIDNWYHSNSSSSYSEGTFGFQYQVQGDTIIAGKTYRKLYYRDIGAFSLTTGIHGQSNVNTTISPFKYLGELRIDNRRVYFTNHTWLSGPYYLPNVEKLIYNFDQQPGDTTSKWYTKITVTKVDSIIINGLYVKRYFFDSTNYDWELEGIGGPLGFLGWNFTSFFFTGGPTYALCYTSGALSYHFPVPKVPVDWWVLQNCFDISLLGINDKRNEQENLQLYPNPSNGNFSLSGHLNGQKVGIHICNTSGQTVYSANIVVDSNYINKDFNLQNLQSGIYFIKLTSDTGQKNLKLVIE